MNNIARNMLASHSMSGGALSNREPMQQHEKLVANTQKWVAQTFYGTMLKEMRKSPFHSEEFEGGRGGQAFEEMFDQRLSDHMSKSAGSPLVNSIVHHIEAKQHLRSAALVRDAKSAYALAMRQGKPKPRSYDPRATPMRAGDIPWNRGKPAPTHKSTKPTPTPTPTQLGHRREDRILPEIRYVAQLAELEVILQEMIAEHRRLLGHMEQHQEAMHVLNHKLMDEITQRQEASRLRLVGLEARRRAATLQLARVMKVEGELSLRRIAELNPQRSEAILKLRGDLREAIEQVRRRAQIAGRVARAVLGHLNTVVRLLAGAVEKAGLYTKNGVPRLASRIGVMETMG